MKFTFTKEVLLKEIAIAQEIISNKTPLSILSNVLLIAKDGSLTIRATDIKVTFETKIPVDITEEGTTTVFCDKFTSIIASMPSGEIEAEQKDQTLIIKSISKKAKFSLKTKSDNDFPSFPDSSSIQFFDVQTKEFKEMITQTIFAVSDDETRYFMNGVFMEKKEDNLIFAATDGRRLAFMQHDFGITLPDFKGSIIPPKILSIIQKRASDEGLLSIGISEKNIFFNFNAYRFSSVLIDGQFPNYDRVVPESQAHSFEADRNDFLQALKRVALLVEQKSKRIYLKISGSNLSISSNENELGTADEEIVCKYEGDDVSIALNYTYLEEPLKVLGSDTVKIEFTDPMRAITLRPETETHFFHIIMPMQME
ncbi:MAG: DNA polymerase III subunit beta [Treponema sp.]